jgi:transcription-repair coupling factor (superfamily II helicase)
VASCKTAEDLTLLERDLIDAFGPCPPAVRTMIELAEIRVRSREFGVRSISLRPPDVVFQVESPAAAGPLFIDAPGSVRVADAQTIHLRLPTNYLERATLVTVLRHLLLRSAQRGKKA